MRERAERQGKGEANELSAYRQKAKEKRHTHIPILCSSPTTARYIRADS